MSSPQKTKENDEPCFVNQIIDYRNGRYQGSADIFSRKPFGKGMFLDQNYRFVLSDWVQGNPNGKTFAVFPDQHIFYGNIMNNRTNKLCAYKQPGKYTIYLKNFFNESNVAIIDDYVSQSLLIIYINYKQWSKLSSIRKSDQRIFISEEGSKNKLMEVVAHKVYLNDEEKWKVIEEYAKQKVESECKHYSKFIGSSFNVNKSSLLVSYENSSQYELSYEGSSIVCKINKNASIDQDYSLKLIGIYDEDEEVFEAFKKIKSKDRTEEFVKGCPPITYTLRPKECLKNIREFYKKSTIFYNSFVSIHSLDQIKSFFMAISEYVDYFLTNKYAETFIFNLNKSSTANETNNVNPLNASQLDNISKQLSQVVHNKKIHERVNIEMQDHTFRDYMMPEQRQAITVHDENMLIATPINKRRKELKPLNESYLEVNANPLSENLKQLAMDVFSIQKQIRKTAQTPSRHSNHSTNKLSQTKQSPSPKATNSKRSDRSNIADFQGSNISASPWKGKKQSKISWR